MDHKECIAGPMQTRRACATNTGCAWDSYEAACLSKEITAALPYKFTRTIGAAVNLAEHQNIIDDAHNKAVATWKTYNCGLADEVAGKCTNSLYLRRRIPSDMATDHMHSWGGARSSAARKYLAQAPRNHRASWLSVIRSLTAGSVAASLLAWGAGGISTATITYVLQNLAWHSVSALMLLPTIMFWTAAMPAGGLVYMREMLVMLFNTLVEPYTASVAYRPVVDALGYAFIAMNNLMSVPLAEFCTGCCSTLSALMNMNFGARHKSSVIHRVIGGVIAAMILACVVKFANMSNTMVIVQFFVSLATIAAHQLGGADYRHLVAHLRSMLSLRYWKRILSRLSDNLKKWKSRGRKALSLASVMSHAGIHRREQRTLATHVESALR